VNGKGQNIGTHLLQLGCLLATLFLALQVIPHAQAQRDAANERPSANAMQLRTSSKDNAPNAPIGALANSNLPLGLPLYDQYNNPATEPPINLGSQDFEPAMAKFDDQAADDFVLTIPRTNCITGVRVMGEYSQGGGPASSFNVYFYQNGAGNLPGALMAAFMNLPYSGTPPDFVIPLPGPYSFCVNPGTYWVSVQARQDFNPSGQWFWHNRTVQSNSVAVWQNPGDGYGTGCICWNRKNLCMAEQIWPDQVFQILGFTEGPTPSPKLLPTSRPRPTPAPRPSP
jgi:hypothetical protein